MRFLTFVIPALFLLNACTQKEPVVLNHLPLDSLKTQIAKFAPVKIGYDDSALSEGDQAALQDLVAAGKIMDEIFLRQVDARNVTLREALNRMNNQEGNVLKAYFDICMGRYDRLEDNQPFINTDQPHPPGANFYPEDMSKDEFEQWIADHPEDEDAFRGTFTVVRRSEEGGLKAIPYSEEYRQLLEQAAFHLREAAQKTTNSSLKIYLTSRAEAFASNDYFQSDMDWMDLADHDIEVVIGPYEVYEDELFNYKAAFEIFLTLVDREDSQRLKKVSQYLDPMERRLPIPDVFLVNLPDAVPIFAPGPAMLVELTQFFLKGHFGQEIVDKNLHFAFVNTPLPHGLGPCGRSSANQEVQQGGNQGDFSCQSHERVRTLVINFKCGRQGVGPKPAPVPHRLFLTV